MMTLATEGTAAATRAAKGSGVRFPGKYLSVTTFKPDGTPVATPVWFVEDGGKLYVDTDGASYKVSRIRTNPAVLLAPCTASGRLKAEPVTGRAEIAPEMPDAQRRLYTRKYRVDRIFVLPVFRLVQALRHKTAPTGAAVALIITPGSF